MKAKPILTEKRAMALTIVLEHAPIRPVEFARQMWPDSPGWNHSLKCGAYGATRGREMARAGGSYLGKLARCGLVAQRYYHGPQWHKLYPGYVLTKQGAEVLAEYNSSDRSESETESQSNRR